MKHHVLLVPGFFGFGRLGDIDYFAGVKAVLSQRFAARGLDVEVSEVVTLPSASLRKRAARVVDALAELAETTGTLHLVGHSTGGLDARLALSPNASLPSTSAFSGYERVHSVVTIACPHFGTPVATYFTRPWGRFLLRTMASYAMFMLERAQLPLRLMLRLGQVVVRLRDPRKRHLGTFDQLYEQLLDDLSEARRLELIQFLKAIRDDDSLLFQLTPAGCDLINACTLAPKLRHASVVVRAPRPSWRGFFRSLFSLHEQLVYPFFAFLHRVSRRADPYLDSALSAEQRAAIIGSFPEEAHESQSDGLVPTRSQVWGEIIHLAQADHLDVVGQFGRREAGKAGGDWLPSHSRFGEAEFTLLWQRVADFIAQSIENAPAFRLGTSPAEAPVIAQAEES